MNWNCEMCRWNVNGYGEKLADKWRIHNYCYRNGCQYESFVADRHKFIKHGKWIKDEFGSKCSSCGLYAYRDKFSKPWESPYCPLCGAKMIDEGEE